MGVSHVGHLYFFCLHRITCLCIATLTQAESYLLLEIFPTCILLSFCPSSILTLGLFQEIICNIHGLNPLIYQGLGFLKNQRRQIKIFL